MEEGYIRIGKYTISPVQVLGSDCFWIENDDSDGTQIGLTTLEEWLDKLWKEEF